MDLLIAFAIVAVIGYFIMASDKSRPECFAWCDIGKSLLVWALVEVTIHMTKGPGLKVRTVGGDDSMIFGGGDSGGGHDAALLGGDDSMLFGGDDSGGGQDAALFGGDDSMLFGGGSVMSHVVRK